MSDTFTCLSFERLLTWIKKGIEQDRIFGIPRSLYFEPSPSDLFRIRRYGTTLETPVGVAAGPHTQLSQNIVSAWLTGARYIELKTVQVLDELEITKPCINMEDEGYNCEWSQELKLEQSVDEYVNALVAIYILRQELDMDMSADPGFLFNMSVGYNLEGIRSPAVQTFLDTMADASDMIEKKLAIAGSFFPKAPGLAIPATVSDNLTISTMHGCPPDEIERIGHYFVADRKLNTTIKLNPTLLGADRLREILNHCLGFETIVPDIAFEHDLKFDDGVALIQNLRQQAAETGVAFNLKLTNTLETENRDGRLPEKEQMVYMSGRPLHVISINLAAKLQKAFNGELDISFSAGADCFNLPDILACGLKPVTVCSDILKPGGYPRIKQYLDTVTAAFKTTGVSSVAGHIKAVSGGSASEPEAVLANLDAYAAKVVEKRAYQKKRFPYSTIKTRRDLNPFDCIHAPCRGACPAGQDVPSYMYYTARGEFEKAFQVILATNPFPNVQGMVCDHPCTRKCTRINFDDPLKIREIKRFIAQQQKGEPHLSPMADNGLSAAVIGGGPSGFSAAYFMRMNGFSVDLFEAKDFGGGMAADAIPCFRLDDLSIQTDIDRIIGLGVNVTYNARVDEDKFNKIRDRYDYVYVAVGAGRAFNLGVPGSDARGVYDQLAFLSGLRRGRTLDIGNNIVIIGGGNSAMDAARTARRLAGPDSSVTILYRRTVKEMPADTEELEDAVKEGIQIRELVSPERIVAKNGRVSAIRCFEMELLELDDSGRPRPAVIEGSLFELKADTVITAIGQIVEVPFFPGRELDVDESTYQTQLEKVYAGGDALRGASTLIRAIADGRNAVKSMVADAALSGVPFPDSAAGETDVAVLEQKMAVRVPGIAVKETRAEDRDNFDLVTQTLTTEAAMAEAGRCLSCDSLCNICTTVCPNRANLAFQADPVKARVYEAVQDNGRARIEASGWFTVRQAHQVLNIGDFCNECGNCTSFCPSAGAPFIDKPKFYLTKDSFAGEADGYLMSGRTIFKKEDNIRSSLVEEEDAYLYENSQVRARFDKHRFDVIDVSFKTGDPARVSLAGAREMAFLYTALRPVFPDMG